MENNVIDEAIANIASASCVLEKYCNEQHIYNRQGSELLEQLSWELQRHANELKEFQYLYGR